jgi:hypothetical protein
LPEAFDCHVWAVQETIQLAAVVFIAIMSINMLGIVPRSRRFNPYIPQNLCSLHTEPISKPLHENRFTGYSAL